MPATSRKTRNHSQASQPLNFGPGSYLESTSRPLYALFFLLPLIAIYELGTILVNTDLIRETQSRVAAFTWLMALAEALGVQRGIAWAFPGFVVVVILLFWHLSTEHPWTISIPRLGWMWLEAALLSIPLFILGAVISSTPSSTPPAPSSHFAADVSYAFQNSYSISGTPAGGHGYLASLITSIGAGIYEELVFRLILIGLILLLLEDVLKLKGFGVTIIAVSISAILFSAYHYFGFERGHFTQFTNEPFELPSFVFRAGAGIYFAFIFRYRGYGVTAGAHAVYNMIFFTHKFLA